MFPVLLQTWTVGPGTLPPQVPGPGAEDEIHLSLRGRAAQAQFPFSDFRAHSTREDRASLDPGFGNDERTYYTLQSPSITFSLFYSESELKTYLFRKSYPPP